MGLLNGVYAGLGQSTGSLLGGYLSKLFGIQRTFDISSVAVFTGAVLFGLQQYYLQWSTQDTSIATTAAATTIVPQRVGITRNVVKRSVEKLQ